MRRTMLHLAQTLVLVLRAGPARADDSPLDGAWMVGVNLGELPWQGSFKPGITLGYHFNDYSYVGAIYQVSDSIARDGTSFNAAGIGLDGIESSRESVGQRFLLQGRLRPHRLSPYLSVGLVFNGEDTETTRFDARSRTIGEGTYAGGLEVVQRRPAAVRPAFGLGYGYTFDFGLSLATEWTGALQEWTPAPEVTLRSDAALSVDDEGALRTRIRDNFGSSITNVYHLFHITAGYVF